MTSPDDLAATRIGDRLIITAAEWHCGRLTWRTAVYNITAAGSRIIDNNYGTAHGATTAGAIADHLEAVKREMWAHNPTHLPPLPRTIPGDLLNDVITTLEDLTTATTQGRGALTALRALRDGRPS
jgi:hypothetical protein